MTETTPLDRAHAAMEAAPGEDAARLRFYERLADSELFLMLAAEPRGTDVEPEVFEVADGRFVLAFDREERLSGFAGQPAPYAALSGRRLARMLAAQGLGLGLNLEVAPSSTLIPDTAIDWLDRTLGHAPEDIEVRVRELHPPAGLPEALVSGLDTKLAMAAGLAAEAYLIGVTYDTGARGHMLAFVDATDGAQSALAQAVSEALIFTGIEAGSLDVGFFAAASPLAAKLAVVGLRFDLPLPDPEVYPRPAAPGRDPDKPPRLR